MVNLQTYSDYLATSQEIWLPINGFEGYYEISTWGRIKSLKRDSNNHKNTKTQILRPYINKKGYYYLSLMISTSRYPRQMHRLVNLTFKFNPLNKPCVNHIDGNKLNNFCYNLEWNTYSENNKHMFDIGLQKKIFGRHINKPKYTETQILEVKRLLLLKKTSSEIGIIMGMSRENVNSIKWGRSWSWLTNIKQELL